MKFKKYAMGLILAASVFTFAACSPAPAPAPVEEPAVEEPAEEPAVEEPAEGGMVDLEDGDYMAEADYDERGWKPFVEMTVADGTITSVNFDYITEDGALKSEDEEYNAAMKDQAGTNPSEYMPALEDSLLETQDVEMVDTVTGATSSTENFKALVKGIMDEGQPGEVVTVELAE